MYGLKNFSSRLIPRIPLCIGRNSLKTRFAPSRISSMVPSFQEVLNSPDPIVIGYHYPCPDGIFAALAAFLSLKQQNQLDRARFVGLTVFHKNHPEQFRLSGDETLYLCDFTGGPGFAKAAASCVRRVIVLDHHKTAREELECGSDQMPSNLFVEFDMNRSGAGIARDYFAPALSPSLQRIFDYIQDADLWKWEFPESKAFGRGLAGRALEYDAQANPRVFEQLLALDPETVIAEGRIKEEEERRLIDAALQGAYTVDPVGPDGARFGPMLAVEVSGELGKLRSHLGNDLAELAASRGLQAMGIVAYTEPGMEDADRQIKLSVRGKGEVDTTRLSKAWGGGGHQLASSCIVERAVFAGWKAAA